MGSFETSLDEEIRALVVRRLRAGAWLILSGSLLLLLTDIRWHRAELPALLPPKLSLLAVTMAAVWVLRQPYRLQTLRWFGAFVMAAAYCATAVASATLHDVTRTPLISIVMAMAASWVPLGFGPQLASIVGAWCSIGLNLWLVHRAGGSLAAFGYSGVAFGAASLSSLYGSYEMQRSFLERRRAAEALIARRQAEHEAKVSAALTRVAHELNASLETTAIAERLVRLALELLRVDAGALFLPDDAGDLGMIRQQGFGSALRTAIPPSFAAATLGAWLASLGDRDVVLLEGDEADEVTRQRAVPGDAPGFALLLALRSGAAVAGILVVAGVEDATSVGERRLLAHGIGQIASTALANARLLTALERASRLKSEFVSTVSHELRTPLNVILGNAEMLDDPHTGAAERETCAAAIRRAGRELLDMVENTLEIGKLEAGRSRPSLVEISLSELWTELQRSCADLARRPGVQLEWGPVEGDLPLTTDPRKLATVVKNLVGNALKFTARGVVRVTLHRSGDALELRVADTGIGIAPERHGEVFEMFRQVDGSDSRAYDGAGLGLYIVERFVRELGGKIDLQSELGQGATFTVSLPIEA